MLGFKAHIPIIELLAFAKKKLLHIKNFIVIILLVLFAHLYPKAQEV